MKLVKKIDKDRKEVFIDTHTKLQQILKINPQIYRLHCKRKKTPIIISSFLYGKAKFRRKKPYTKTLFAPKRHLLMVVSGRVLERQYQGLFESGPKNSTLNLKI